MSAGAASSSKGVLDTSTVISLGQITDAELLPAEPLITAVTLAELSVGPLAAGDERERSARQAHLQQAEADFDPLPFDASAARAFGQVAASLPPQSVTRWCAQAVPVLLRVRRCEGGGPTSRTRDPCRAA